jgi:ribosome maturation factor RimP
MELNKINQIRKLIVPILELQQIDLIDIELKGRSGSRVLRIFVDIDGGISLDQCVDLSRQISDLLDTRDLIAGWYRLEVSSPGLDRPLKTERDFTRNLGRKVRVIYTDKDEEKTISGIIDQVDDSWLFVQHDSVRIAIDISKILVAKIIPKW